MSEFPPDFNIDNDPIPFNCNKDCNSFIEVIKYLVQVLYIFPSIILNVLLIFTIFWTKELSNNSFFAIYFFDCLTSLILLSLDMFFTRLIMYVSPICPIIGPFFYDPSIFLKVVFVLTHYCRTSKSVIQIFSVVNRMTCIIFPTKYYDMWHNRMKLVIFLITVLPCGACWNISISRIYMTPFNGGFSFSYSRKVEWAMLSKFQFGYVTCAFIFTVVCTSMTVYALIKLRNRVKSTEKGLCIASMVISSGFLSVAIFQAFFAFCPNCIDVPTLQALEFLTFDFLNIGSPIVIICISRRLRLHILRIMKIDGTATATFIQMSKAA